MRALRVTLAVIGVFQLPLGARFRAAGTLALSQVTTAAFAPVLFIGALPWFHPRRLPTER